MPQKPRKNLENKYEYYAEVGRKWRKNNPEKTRAGGQARYAVSIGLIKKAKVCMLCKKETKLIGHHLNYKHPLFVIWLCVSCHRKEHSKLNKKAAK